MTLLKSESEVSMKYFDQWEAMVTAGDIPVNKWITLTIARVKRFKKEYIFKQKAAEKRINFIENEASNTKGLSTRLKLALVEKVWLEVAWGFYHEITVTKTDPETMQEYEETETRRLIHQNAFIVPRGTGKTTLGAAIGLVGLIIDGEYGADVQNLAYDRTQAGYLFDASIAMTNREGTMLNDLRNMDILHKTKTGLRYNPTNSIFTIKTSDYDSLDGTNSHYNIFDEIHTYDDDFIKVVNDGSARKRKNWITWYLSTNGTKRDRVFDRYLDIWKKVLTGDIEDDSIMPWIYQLDSPEEINDDNMWPKAMPLLGITTEKQEIHRDIKMSKNDPAMQAELMAKTFNLPVNNYLAYFTNEESMGNKKMFDRNKFIGNEDKYSRAIIGMDLSEVNDITSISFMIPDGDERYYLNKKYLPEKTVEKMPKEMRDKYQSWAAQGDFTIHNHDFNDAEVIFEDLLEFMEKNKILPMVIGYDVRSAAELVRKFVEHFGNITTVDMAQIIPQTVPVLSQKLKIYKAKLGAGKIIFDDPVSTFAHLNVVVKIDANNNIFPNKQKAKNKIDVFASQLDAFIVYENNKEELSPYF